MALVLSPTDLEHLLLTTPDDTEDAPWMVMGNQQLVAVEKVRSALFLSWVPGNPDYCVESFLPIVTLRPDGRRTLQVSPDLFVARAPSRLRDSWNLVTEQVVPELVVEVSSATSFSRDLDTKPAIYGSLRVGEQVVREYVLFVPWRQDGGPMLSGYHREAAGAFVPWQVDGQGVLWSAVLGFGFFVEEGLWLRLMDAERRRLPTWEEAHREDQQRLIVEEAARRVEVAPRRGGACHRGGCTASRSRAGTASPARRAAAPSRAWHVGARLIADQGMDRFRAASGRNSPVPELVV